MKRKITIERGILVLAIALISIPLAYGAAKAIKGSEVRATTGIFMSESANGLYLFDDSRTTGVQVMDGGQVKISNAYTLPTSDGTANQMLVTNGSGAVSFGSTGGTALSAAAVIADHAVVRGAGGARGVQDSSVTIDDSGNLEVTVGNLEALGDLTIGGDGDIFGELLARGGLGGGTAVSPIDLLHVYDGDSGSTPVENSHMTVESDGDCGISILSGNTSLGVIYFGDDGDADEGYIALDQEVEEMKFSVNGSERLTIDNAGEVNMPDVYGDTGSATNIDLFIDSNGLLGADGSSLRFKQNLRDVTNDDRKLARDIIAILKKYDRKSGEFDGEVGLIAEEMYEIDPRFVACEMDSFVVNNPDGTTTTLRSESNRPLSVRWHRVTPFLFATLGYEVTAMKVEQNLQRRQIDFIKVKIEAAGVNMDGYPTE